MSESPTDQASEGGQESVSFDEGRYLYCAVDTADAVGPSIDTPGVGDGTPYLIERNGVGLVVQACSSPYESTEPATVRRWLLQHQAVIDEAGETFGTPLPFRFDTILKGDDDRARAWLDDAADRIADELEAFAQQWEYRIEVLRDQADIADQIATDDDHLAELREERENAPEGTAFLLDKQYEQEVRGLTERRHRSEMESLAERLRDFATDVRAVDRPAAGLGDERTATEGEHRDTLAVLTPERQEGDIGDLLDEHAAQPGVEIRFTGPWPPYTFAPELGRDS